MQPSNPYKILVPIDFSETSLNALHTAIEMAKRQEATLFLIHVVSTTTGIAFPEGVAVVDMAYYDLIESNKKNIEQLSATITSEHGIDCQSRVISGAVCPTVVEEASRLRVDLIVMGTHGVSGLREFFIGSNAYAIIKLAQCPVLTIPPHKKWERFKKILFPVRPATNALAKYEYARQIIHQSNAKLIVMGLLEYESKQDFETFSEDTKGLVKALEKDEIQIETQFFFCESFAQKILEKAEVLKVDLVIITATLDYKIQDFFVGPFAQQVVNHANVPILSIRNT